MGIPSPIEFIRILIDLYTWVIIINVMLSWVMLLMSRNIYSRNVSQYMNVMRKIYHVTHTLTEPVLAPIRRMLYPVTRQIGGLDFSPFALILLLMFLRRILSRI